MTFLAVAFTSLGLSTLPCAAQEADFLQLLSFGYDKDCPCYKALVRVNTPDGDQGLLTHENFELFVHGEPQPFWMCGRSEDPNPRADYKYVFVVDTSVSMAEELAIMTEHLEDFVRSILTKGVAPTAVALVEFRDTGNVVQEFTADPNRFLNAFRSLSAFGGGDIPEGALEGVHTALNDLEWGPSTIFGEPDFVVRHMYVFTDSTVHYRGDGLDTSTHTSLYTMPETIQALNDFGVQTIGYGPRLTPELPELTETSNDIRLLGPHTSGAAVNIENLSPEEPLIQLPLPKRYLYELCFDVDACCTLGAVDVCIQATDPAVGTDEVCREVGLPPCPDWLHFTWVGHEPYSELPTVTLGLNYKPKAVHLPLDAISVTENGVPMELVPVSYNPDANGTCDIAFIVDNSGSMQNRMPRIREEIEIFVSELEEFGSAIRYGLVTIAGAPALARQLTPITGDFLNAFNNFGYGEDREYALDAINFARNNLNWSDGGRIYVVITDEFTEITSYTMPAAANDLVNEGAQVVVISPANLGGKLPISLNENDVSVLAEATGGIWQDIEGYDSSKLSADIALRLLSHQVFTYRSPFTELDGFQRQVEVRAVHPVYCESAVSRAYFTPEPVFVDRSNASGVHDGKAWNTAFLTIQEGIDAAAAKENVASVWVAAGRYDEDRTNSQSPYSGSLLMARDVNVYGGFNGTELTVEERNPGANLTIIDGSVSRGGLPAYHVVVGANGADLSGFLITGGRGEATGASHTRFGGGIYHEFASPLVEDCIIMGNEAVFGGGVYNQNSGPTFQNCLIVRNHANFGGAFRNNDAILTLNHVTIANNTAASSGGGMYNSTSTVYLDNSIVWGNSVGGINSVGSTAVHFDQSVVQGGPAGALNVAPGFVDVSGDNWRLLPWSPLLNAANPAKSASVDLRWAGRPLGDGPDIGAYEFIPAMLDDPVITTDGGNGPGEDYISNTLTPMIGGMADPNSASVRVYGSNVVEAEFDDSTGTWTAGLQLGPGANEFFVTSLTAAGDPGGFDSITLLNGLERQVTIDYGVQQTVVEYPNPVAVVGSVTAVPEAEAGTMVGHPVQVRFTNGDDERVRFLFVDAQHEFFVSWVPPAPGTYAVAVRYPGVENFLGTGWIDTGVTVTVEDPPPPEEPFDINNDDKVDAIDIQLVINAVLGLEVPEGVDPDVNNDGVLNSVDIQLVILAVLGQA